LRHGREQHLDIARQHTGIAGIKLTGDRRHPSVRRCPHGNISLYNLIGCKWGDA
jgi:hypothetical protein